MSDHLTQRARDIEQILERHYAVEETRITLARERLNQRRVEEPSNLEAGLRNERAASAERLAELDRQEHALDDELAVLAEQRALLDAELAALNEFLKTEEVT